MKLSLSNRTETARGRESVVLETHDIKNKKKKNTYTEKVLFIRIEYLSKIKILLEHLLHTDIIIIGMTNKLNYKVTPRRHLIIYGQFYN